MAKNYELRKRALAARRKVGGKRFGQRVDGALGGRIIRQRFVAEQACFGAGVLMIDEPDFKCGSAALDIWK